MFKKLLIIIFCLFFAWSAYGGELISEQTQDTTPAANDLLMGELANNSDFIYFTNQQLFTAILGASYDTSAELDALFAAKQALDADLTAVAALTTTAYGLALLEVADEAALKALINLEIGTDVLAQQTIGIADDNLVEMDDADAADNDFARFTANGLEGRSYAEVAADLSLEIGTDVLAEQTIGIADNNLLEVDHAAAADNDYAKFTANGLEGRSYAELLTDVGITASTTEINTPLDGASVTLTEFQELEAIGATTISAAQWAGVGASTAYGIGIMALADEAALQALITSPWADADVADNITASSYLPLAGGTLTGELVIDNLGAEFTAGDDHSDCSAFSATGGGIFFDDSEGIFKKCQDNVLTDLDTDTGGATAYDDIGNPDASGSITMGAYTGTYTSGTEAWGGIIIESSDADNAGDTTLLSLKHYDDFDTNSVFLHAINDSDSGADTIFKITGLGVYVGAGTPDQTLNGNDMYVTGFLEVDGPLYVDGGIISASSTDPYIQFDVTDADDTDWVIGTNADADASSDDDLEFRTSTTPGTGVLASLQPDTGDFVLNGSVFILEQADASTDVAGYGQIWVNTATPNELWWTDDAGTDTQLGVAGSDDQTLAEVLAQGVDANDLDITSMDKLEGFDAAVYIDLGADTLIDLTADGYIIMNTPYLEIADGVVFIKEQAEADADRAGYGQIWINTATPNELWWTDDAGTDTQLGIAALSEDAVEAYIFDADTETVSGVWTWSANIEFGHASDTTISRVSAGVVAIEGNNIYVAGGTDVADADVADDITIDLATLATTVTVSDDESTADAHEVVFTTDNSNLESDGTFNYNPSTGTVTTTEFVGGGVGLTGLDGENIANDTIDNDSIDWADMTDLTTDGALDADVVDEAHIADNGIDSEHYNDGSIDIEHMSTDSVDYDNTTGSVKSLTPVTDDADDFAAAFTGANLYGGTFVANLAGDVDLPAPVAGMNFTIITMGDIEVDILPTAGDDLLLDGTQLDDNHDASNTGSAGDIAVVQYYDADGWLVTSNGWTEVAD